MELLDEPIRLLNLPHRVVAALTKRHVGMPTIRDLTELTSTQLLALPRVGPIALEQTKAELARVGLHLRTIYKE